ncbi:MAG TPA: hypothetical protein ENH99_01925 [Candidatus Pacearchaeota archaeon]|nr:hypothetical protein [Candidatus Pacearchaeota archaeon]
MPAGLVVADDRDNNEKRELVSIADSDTNNSGSSDSTRDSSDEDDDSTDDDVSVDCMYENGTFYNCDNDDDEELEIEVEIREKIAKVEVEFNDKESKFTLETTDRDSIIDEIVKRMGLTREQVEDNIEFEDEREKIREKIERDRERFRMKEEIKMEFVAADGSIVKIERKVEVENGKVKIKVKRKITYLNGTVVEKIIIIEREGNETRMRAKLKVEGVDGLEVETELEIEDEFEGNETDLKAVMSNGRKALIKIMPDAASDIAIERLKALNFTKIELKEVRHRNEIKVAYKFEAKKEGKFLGIFKLKLKMSSLVDPETGEVLDTTKPWWAFLVSGEDSDQRVVFNDTIDVDEVQGTLEPVN